VLEGHDSIVNIFRTSRTTFIEWHAKVGRGERPPAVDPKVMEAFLGAQQVYAVVDIIEYKCSFFDGKTELQFSMSWNKNNCRYV
jgi:hypothetical protein